MQIISQLTLAPCCSRMSTNPFPIPLAPPVTAATLPSIPKVVSSYHYQLLPSQFIPLTIYGPEIYRTAVYILAKRNHAPTQGSSTRNENRTVNADGSFWP